MLSVAKIKQHGLKDDRWTTNDKLSQFKGLLSLYKRDKKIVAFDHIIQKKKTRRELYEIQKNIIQNREQLGNLIKGDRQKLRNQLQEHKELQLKYQDLHPKEALDRIEQEAFNKRKELDLLKYKTKQQCAELTEKKLYLALLEDRIKYGEIMEVNPTKNQAEIITGKVQDAILKKEAAVVVHQTYKDILRIMKKDQIYYHAVITALQNDGLEQGKCLIRTTELGQLAMEYLDDRRDEYNLLEINVKHDMKIRLESLGIAQERAQQIHKEMRLLIRRDSDVNLCRQKIQPLPGETELKKDVKELEEKLEYLKQITEVTHIDKIFNCYNEQQHQRQRLKDLWQKVNDGRDLLENRHNHAQMQLQSMINSVAENTFEYMELKVTIREAIKQQKMRKIKTLKRIENRNEVLAKVRTALLRLNSMCGFIVDRNPKVSKTQPSMPIFIPDLPDQLEHQLMVIIDGVHKKLTTLVTGQAMLTGDALCHAENRFQTFIQRTNRNVLSTYEVIVVEEESLVADVAREDTEVPSRAEIKSRSDKIVEMNQKTEFDIGG